MAVRRTASSPTTSRRLRRITTSTSAIAAISRTLRSRFRQTTRVAASSTRAAANGTTAAGLQNCAGVTYDQPVSQGAYASTPFDAQRDTATNLNWEFAHNGLNDDLQALYVVGSDLDTPYGLYGSPGADPAQATTNYSCGTTLSDWSDAVADRRDLSGSIRSALQSRPHDAAHVAVIGWELQPGDRDQQSDGRSDPLELPGQPKPAVLDREGWRTRDRSTRHRSYASLRTRCTLPGLSTNRSTASSGSRSTSCMTTRPASTSTTRTRSTSRTW